MPFSWRIAQKHNSGKGQTNRDWWPNALNLKILSQHSSMVIQWIKI